MSIRLLFIKVSFGLVFFVIAARLVDLMVINHNKYKVLAQQQHLVERVIVPNRGTIKSVDGYPLATNASRFMMFAVPREMEDKSKTVDRLVDSIIPMIDKTELVAQIQPKPTPLEIEDYEGEYLPFKLPTDWYQLKRIITGYGNGDDLRKESLKKVITEALSDNQNQYVQLFTNLDSSMRDEFEQLNLKGLHYEERSGRVYPEKFLGAHVLGFVGKDQDGSTRGYFGVEGQFDRYLSGKVGYELIEKDVLGKKIPYGVNRLNSPIDGHDIELTLRRELQYIIEKQLMQGVETYKAKGGAAIVMDPYTGAVWAMASMPTYHPQYWTDELDGESDVAKVTIFNNTAIASNYEPGSVMKPVTMAMALNEGLVNPNSIYDDVGAVIYSGYPVRTWNNRYSGKITMTEILQLSNNTGAAWVGHQVGFDKFSRYIAKFNFGKSEGIDLQGEEAGIVRDPTTWRDIDLANMSFGQGVSVTPLQMAVAFSALVNGGNIYKPYVVNRIYRSSGNGVGDSGPDYIETEPQIINRVISESTSEQIRYMMRKVVTDGEFKWFVKKAGMDAYSIGGKTGTAQIPVNGQYDPSKTITTFVGFAPVEKPKFVMLMKLSEPSTSTYSADTVVPMWMETASSLVQYFSIPKLTQ